MEEKLFSLPLQVQIALGGGYLAYLIAYAGIHQHHTASEVFFRSIAFGMVATAILLWSPEAPDWLAGWKHPLWRPVIAIVSTIFVGGFWRWRGMRWSRNLLRSINVSWTDDIPTAWLSITATDTDTCPSQIAVELLNGRLLWCDDTRKFGDAPFGPCVFGLDGSIAMYVTSERRPDGSWLDHCNIRHAIDGDQLTYIPAAQIQRIDLRLWTKPTGKDVVPVVLATDVAVAKEES